jgi:hypothetical protein
LTVLEKTVYNGCPDLSTQCFVAFNVPNYAEKTI